MSPLGAVALAAFVVSVGTGVAALRGGVSAHKSDVVLDVIDGDTIILAGIGRARLVGIDAPERGEPCYEASREALRAMLVHDHPGYVVRPSLRVRAFGRDPYRRELVALWVDGLSVNVEMARLGRAKAYSATGPLAAEIAQAETAARVAGRGLWSPVCVAIFGVLCCDDPAAFSTGVRRISAGFPQDYKQAERRWLSVLAAL